MFNHRPCFMSCASAEWQRGQLVLVLASAVIIGCLQTLQRIKLLSRMIRPEATHTCSRGATKSSKSASMAGLPVRPAVLHACVAQDEVKTGKKET